MVEMRAILIKRLDDLTGALACLSARVIHDRDPIEYLLQNQMQLLIGRPAVCSSPLFRRLLHLLRQSLVRIGRELVGMDRRDRVRHSGADLIHTISQRGVGRPFLSRGRASVLSCPNVSAAGAAISAVGASAKPECEKRGHKTVCNHLDPPWLLSIYVRNEGMQWLLTQTINLRESQAYAARRERYCEAGSKRGCVKRHGGDRSRFERAAEANVDPKAINTPCVAMAINADRTAAHGLQRNTPRPAAT